MMQNLARVALPVYISLFGLSCSEKPGFKVSDTGIVLANPEQGPPEFMDEGDARGNVTSYSSENDADLDAETSPAGDVDSLNANGVSSDAGELASGSAQERFRDSCDGTLKKSIVQRIHFPEIKNCRFGSAGNMNRRDRYLQARESQSEQLVLPQGAQLCGFELHSEESRIQYDDFMILTLNNLVLLSSNSKILNKLSGIDQGAFNWDFLKIRGTAVDFNSPAYCLGGTASSCKVPVTDTPGKFEVTIEPDVLFGVADKIVDQSSFEIALTATGDNDDEDCWHTAIDLDFTLHYVD